jgi:N-carbamoylputrescine amidase
VTTAHGFEVIVADEPLDSPFRDPGDGVRARGPDRLLRIGAVQCAWNPDAPVMEATLRTGVAVAVAEGAEMVFLQELTRSPYFCVSPDEPDALKKFGEPLETGPTVMLARLLAIEHNVAVHASLYEQADSERGYNTAVCVDASGVLVARTRKTHIPEFEYYHEDAYFEPGDDGCPVVDIAGARFGFPTCWDQWFPELARKLSMDGAEVIVYPTAIGSEPHRPGFDSQPMWRQMIAANGLANATFMVAVNRIGVEGPISFYGSSFISDPYGRVIVEAPRDRPAVLVAQLDLGQRADWLDFGLMYTRRPDAYRRLADGTDLGRPKDALGS